MRDNGNRNSGVDLPSLSYARITSVTEGGIGKGPASTLRRGYWRAKVSLLDQLLLVSV